MTNSIEQSDLCPCCLKASIIEFPCYFLALKMLAALQNSIIMVPKRDYSYQSSLN